MKRRILLFVIALASALGAFLTIDFNSTLAGPTPGTQVHLPAITGLGDEADACQVVIEVQNAGNDFSKAMLLFWDEPGTCEQCNGPFNVECSGLLAPGSSWNFLGPYTGQVPSGAKSATVFSLNANQAGDDIFADAVCETALSAVRADCDEYLLFKQAFDEGGTWRGFDFGAHPGEPLAVEVVRKCQTATMDAPVTGAYSGVAGEMQGVQDPVWSGYAYYMPLPYGGALGQNTFLYLQNVGLKCTSVELWFMQQGDCLRHVTSSTPDLAPGEVYQVDVSSHVDSEFVGNVWVQSSKSPLAIVADTVSQDALTSQSALPVELNYTFDPEEAFFTPGDQINFAPLIYSADEGWDTEVHVQNLGTTLNAKVKVSFYDASGQLKTSMEDWVCPRGSRTFSLPATNFFPGTAVGWIQIESLEHSSPDGSPLQTNVASLVTLHRRASSGEVLETLSYPTLPASQVEGTSRALLPSGGYKASGSGSGLTSEIALTNFNRAPGGTDFRIDLYTENRVQKSLYYTLGAGQMTYIDLHEQGLVDPGSHASVVVEAENTTQGSVAFGAVGVLRYNAVRQPDPANDTPGDQTAAVTAWPDAGTFAPVLSDECPAAEPAWLGGKATQVHLPTLTGLGDEYSACDVLIDVQNVGVGDVKAMVLFWSGPGRCSPQCSGPFKVECSGLLKPRASWNFVGPNSPAQVPADARSAVVFSLSAAQVDGDVFADAVCETAFFNIRYDCDEYRRFKQAFNSGGTWRGLDFGMYQGQPLAVNVSRKCQTAWMDALVSAAYRGLTPADLGQPDRGCSFEYQVGPVYAGWDGRNTWLVVQNAGDECTSVQFRFRRQGDCLRVRSLDTLSLAPGESYAFDANLLGPLWLGSVQVIASQPLAIVADTLSSDILGTATALPAPAPEQDFQPYRTTAYGPLFYREHNGWDSRIYVFNLDRRRTAMVRTTFLDETGTVIDTQSKPVCPLGTQRFSLPVTDDQAGRAVGSVRVTAEGDAPPPIAAVAELTRYDGPAKTVVYEEMMYTLSPATQVEGVEQIALGSLYKDVQNSGLLSEVVVANWNTTSGSTSLALDLYDQNGLLDTLNKTIAPGQTLRIGLDEESDINDGWAGSAILRATDSSQSGGPSLSAVVVNSVSASFDSEVPGDEAQVYEGRPLDPAPPLPTPTPTPSPTPTPDPLEVAGSSAYVPALRTIGEQSIDVGGWIEVQNVGSQNVVALLTYWGTGGDCATLQEDSASSGLLAPGASWRWTTAGLPPWAQSARVEAYTDAPGTGGVPIEVPLAVAVGRSAPSPDEGITQPLSTGYIAVPPSGLGMPNDDGQYEVIVPGVYAGWDNSNTWLNVQNAGDACADVTLEFKMQGECLFITTAQVFGLAPGETRIFDASTSVGPSWLGSVRLRSAQPLAVVADTASGSVASSQVAAPANVPNAGFAPHTTTAYGAINFAAQHGWNSEIFVHSLASHRIGQVSTSFLDPRGAILKGLSDLICPEGQQSFLRQTIDGRPGEQLQAIEVRSDGPDSAPVVASVQAVQFDGAAQTQVFRKLGYGLASSRLISGTDAIALPWLARDYSDPTLSITTPLTSQVAIANWNHTAGVSEVALDLLGGGCVAKTITRTLAAGQTVGINLADEGDVPAGWRGPGIVRLVQSTQSGGMRLSAAAADRTDQSDAGPVAIHEGVPLFGSYDAAGRPTLPAADFNWDGEVNLADVQMIAAGWRDSPPANPRYDRDGDGTVSVKDIMEVVAQLGELCP